MSVLIEMYRVGEYNYAMDVINNIFKIMCLLLLGLSDVVIDINRPPTNDGFLNLCLWM